jgi:CyaY protein
MNDTEFMQRVEEILMQIEESMDNQEADIDASRSGDGILTLEFENRSQVIINRQQNNHEIWVAARSGGFHFSFQPDRKQWQDGKNNELFALLTRVCTEQAGEEVVL